MYAYPFSVLPFVSRLCVKSKKEQKSIVGRCGKVQLKVGKQLNIYSVAANEHRDEMRNCEMRKQKNNGANKHALVPIGRYEFNRAACSPSWHSENQ